MKLEDYRIEHNILQEDFARELGISIPTLARIEAAERDGSFYRMTRRRAKLLTDALKKRLGRIVTIDDLDAVIIAPPRTGRPKRDVVSGNVVENIA